MGERLYDGKMSFVQALVQSCASIFGDGAARGENYDKNLGRRLVWTNPSVVDIDMQSALPSARGIFMSLVTSYRLGSLIARSFRL